MAIRSFLGRLRFSGNVKIWMDQIDRWYAEDFPTGKASRNQYMAGLMGYLFPIVRARWLSEGRAAELHELAVIETAWNMTDSPARSFAKYDFADYVADRVSFHELADAFQRARAFIREELQ